MMARHSIGSKHRGDEKKRPLLCRSSSVRAF